MKAKLEPKGFQYRGVSLVSETEEERQVLRDIFYQRGRNVALCQMSDGQIEIILAPTAEEKR